MRTIIIGYGNPSRRDDGVALVVVNALRLRWGQPTLTPLTDGWEDVGGLRDSLFLQQLTPELAATLAQYDLVVFVDASLPQATERVQRQRIEPRYQMGVVSHHMEPATLISATNSPPRRRLPCLRRWSVWSRSWRKGRLVMRNP